MPDDALPAGPPHAEAPGALPDGASPDAATLRARYGAAFERSLKKDIGRLDKHCRDFIALSPFLVLASSGAGGRVDASPRGDAPGFVRVLDDNTVVLPDRLGNNRLDSLQNVAVNPQVGLIFFVPGINETLRINGRARITLEPAVLEPLAVNGKPPRSALVIEAEEVYFHCAKALIRSDLWNPEKQVERRSFPSLGRILAEQIGGVEVKEAEASVEEGYRTRLY
jgi:hypothetical protein